MNRYSQASLTKLATCHEEIQAVCSAVISGYDHKILCGRRGHLAQTAAFEGGFSNAEWPESPHNALPPVLSEAVDIAPWHADRPHIRWEAEREFIFLAGHMMQAAAALGVILIWGGDWDRDRDLSRIHARV